MGGDAPRGLFRQHGGAGTVSRDDQAFWRARSSRAVGQADGLLVGAVRVPDGPAAVFVEDRSRRDRDYGTVFAHPS